MVTMQEAGTFSDEDLVMVRLPPDRVEIARDWIHQVMQGVQFNNPVLFSIDQAIGMCREGKMQLWVVRDLRETNPMLFFLTEVIEYPAGTTVRICLIRGRGFRKVMDRFWPQFQDWCRAQGACMIEAEAQPSLGRIMKRYGYIPTAVKFHKPLVTMQ